MISYKYICVIIKYPDIVKGVFHGNKRKENNNRVPIYFVRTEVVLVVGLPFSNYRRDRLKRIDYYNKENVLDFSYEEEEYFVTIVKIIVCPQCYSAIASKLDEMKEDYLIVDIGNQSCISAINCGEYATFYNI